MKKIFYTWEQVQGACLELSRQLNSVDWRPDYIVGLTRGGLVPALLISQYLNVPMETLKVSLRDSNSESESNLWMASDAFEGKKILIVDDINDTGATIAWIKKDWQSSCLPNSDVWERVWGDSVRIATLVDNRSSYEFVEYSAWEVNKAEEDCWLVFPWEEFWIN